MRQQAMPIIKDDIELPKQPPHNIEAEQALLGAILLNNDVLHRVTDIVEAGHFFDPLHGRIYKACARIIHSGQRATPVTLKPYFENEEPVGPLTVPQYLGRLASQGTGTLNAVSYADTIRNQSDRRSLIIIGEDVTASAYDAHIDCDVSDIIEEAEESLFKLGHGKITGNRQVDISEAVQNAIENLQDPTDNNLIKTGLHRLDEMFGGFRKGHLNILAARPAMGKSALAQSLSMSIAERGYGVAYFSLEMTHEEIAQRCIADLLYSGENSILYSDIANKSVPSHHMHRILEAGKRVTSIPLTIDDKRGITAPQLVAKARHIARAMEQQGNRLDIIVVDHLGLLKPSNAYRGNKTNEIGEISDALATLAKDLDVSVVALHQLNREVEKRNDKRPMLSDLRDSGNLEQDAHVVMFVYRAVYYLQNTKFDDDEKEIARLDLIERCRNEMEIIIAKQRGGECGTAHVNAFMGSNAIRNKVA